MPGQRQPHRKMAADGARAEDQMRMEWGSFGGSTGSRSFHKLARSATGRAVGATRLCPRKWGQANIAGSTYSRLSSRNPRIPLRGDNHAPCPKSLFRNLNRPCRRRGLCGELR